MATSRLKGNAQIRYTPQGGSELVHVLSVPILVSPAYRFAYVRSRRRWEAFNDDGTDREIYVLGDETHQFEGEIRYDDQGGLLRNMLVDALENNTTLNYSVDGGATEFPLILVRVNNQNGATIQLDPTRFAFGEWMSRVLLRRVDGGNLDTLFGLS